MGVDLPQLRSIRVDVEIVSECSGRFVTIAMTEEAVTSAASHGRSPIDERIGAFIEEQNRTAD